MFGFTVKIWLEELSEVYADNDAHTILDPILVSGGGYWINDRPCSHKSFAVVRLDNK